jgi:hypothetical protein
MNKGHRWLTAALLLASGACQPREDEQSGRNTIAPAAPAAPSAPAPPSLPAASAAARAPTGPAAPATSHGEPAQSVPTAAAIDPKSAAGAAQVVQQYGALIEQENWKQAASLWDDPADGAKFARTISDYRDIRSSVGKPGDMEGAAGSSYVTVPIELHALSSTGTAVTCAADVTLRRVNDVPGSTDRQRRWHIRTIDC